MASFAEYDVLAANYGAAFANIVKRGVNLDAALKNGKVSKSDFDNVRAALDAMYADIKNIQKEYESIAMADVDIDFYLKKIDEVFENDVVTAPYSK